MQTGQIKLVDSWKGRCRMCRSPAACCQVSAKRRRRVCSLRAAPAAGPFRTEHEQHERHRTLQRGSTKTCLWPQSNSGRALQETRPVWGQGQVGSAPRPFWTRETLNFPQPCCTTCLRKPSATCTGLTSEKSHICFSQACLAHALNQYCGSRLRFRLITDHGGVRVFSAAYIAGYP